MTIKKIDSLIKKHQQQLIKLKQELEEQQEYKALIKNNKDFSLNKLFHISNISILQQSIYNIEQELELLELRREFEFYKGLKLM